MSAWTNTSPATNLLYKARTELTRGALELACHAAVPAVLDVGFLHLLRINFFLDPPAALAYDVEAELLNSPLFQEIGDGLYEVDPQLRARLLAGLDAAFGFDRLRKVALLLEQYTNQAGPWAPRELEYAQRLTALSIVEPIKAAEWLDYAQRASAGEEPLGKEWFVAMRERLSLQRVGDENLAAECARLCSEAEETVETVHALGQLGLLPGADLAAILEALLRMSAAEDPEVARLAQAVRETLLASRPARDEPGGGLDLVVDQGSLIDLLGLRDLSDKALGRLRRRPIRDRLRVPIGVSADGLTVELDLKESAQGGAGPHGVLVGANGSGKSELLRTLVLSLALAHTAETVNFFLVEFFGDTTFGPLRRLPHTSAVVTEYFAEPGVIDRLRDAINGELARRQEVLRAAGGYASQRDYEKARAAGEPLAPLPSLMIIFDEFTEMLHTRPDFIEIFIQIGRVGRSLGVHMLLAAKRIEEGRLRGLDTYFSYRIGLRTLSAKESSAVLGTTDAFTLSREPGHGYLRMGSEPLVQFKTAYVSGPYPGRGSLLDVVVERLEGEDEPAHRAWLPPLRESPTLDGLLPPVGSARLEAVVGIVDKPFDQRQEGFWFDLEGTTGHAVVVGGVGSGKTTLLRTIVVSLALTHSPRDVQFYCLDFGGGALSTLSDLLQVGGVASRRDTALIRRTVAELRQLVEMRERRFVELDVASMREYRRAGGRDDDPFGDVFLVIDGWARIRAEFEDLEPAIADIANRGLSFGVHLLVSANRWADIRPSIRGTFGSRVELRLSDPADSEFNRRAANNVPPDVPGRGITPDGTQFLAALPRMNDVSDPGGLAAAVARAWPGPGAPAVRLLPADVPYGSVPTMDGEGLPIGIAESDLLPVYLDFRAEPHFLLFGDTEAGKSTFLRALARTITDRYEPAEARVLVVDYRRSLLGDVNSSHLLGYGTSSEVVTSLLTEVATAMRNRLPSPDVTPEQLRNRSWWKGPELFILVDDYDLVAAGPDDPLRPLLEFLPQARDLGLHLVLTRRTGGASRALFDPIVGRLRELDTPGIVMAGDRDEGALLGNVRPGPLPPGRGWLVSRRGGTRLVQLFNLPASG